MMWVIVALALVVYGLTWRALYAMMLQYYRNHLRNLDPKDERAMDLLFAGVFALFGPPVVLIAWLIWRPSSKPA